MKKIVIFIVLFLSLSPFTAFGALFGKSKKPETIVKIKTGAEGERLYLYVDISGLDILYISEKKEVRIGKFFRSPPNKFGEYQIELLPIHKFFMDNDEQFEEWIQTVKPGYKCLSIKGMHECEKK